MRNYFWLALNDLHADPDPRALVLYLVTARYAVTGANTSFSVTCFRCLLAMRHGPRIELPAGSLHRAANPLQAIQALV